MLETLRDLRVRSGKSISEVAEVLFVKIQTVYRYEKGLRSISIEQVLPLAELYDVSAEEVIQAQINSFQNDR